MEIHQQPLIFDSQYNRNIYLAVVLWKRTLHTKYLIAIISPTFSLPASGSERLELVSTDQARSPLLPTRLLAHSKNRLWVCTLGNGDDRDTPFLVGARHISSHAGRPKVGVYNGLNRRRERIEVGALGAALLSRRVEQLLAADAGNCANGATGNCGNKGSIVKGFPNPAAGIRELLESDEKASHSAGERNPSASPCALNDSLAKGLEVAILNIQDQVRLVFRAKTVSH